ncbi:MAG: ATPase, T2SS/T4P/T4SS family [Acidobacteriota bacterium]
MSFDLILPFLRPIEPLIRDPEVSEIMVNGSSRVFTERQGRIEPVPGVQLSEKSLQVALRNIARLLGDDISESKPILDARLPDGSRVAAILPPCSLGGITLTIRKFSARHLAIEDLIRLGSVERELAGLLQTKVQQRQNLLISGGTGTGKTTLLNILADFIPDEERIILIEDTAEIQIRKSNLVRFEARREQAQTPAVTIRDLLRATLRHRPDRIIVGEIRGGEAFDFLQALNTGHSGTLSTIHANSAYHAISRFVSCTLQSDIDLPYKAIKSNFADSIHLLLHIERRGPLRFVSELLEVRGYDVDQDRYELVPLYQTNPSG